MAKQYGIRVTLPPGDTMTTLLGEGWESFRWYDTPLARDAAFEAMLQPPPYYRSGDLPSQVLQKVQRD